MATDSLVYTNEKCVGCNRCIAVCCALGACVATEPDKNGKSRILVDKDKCIGCGACASVCPQHIDIPGVLKEYNEMLHTGPTWAEMCRQREEAAEKMRKQLNE